MEGVWLGRSDIGMTSLGTLGVTDVFVGGDMYNVSSKEMAKLVCS